MKKLILLAAITTITFSCCKTPEEKANALIKEKMEKVLYYPESYDPAETIIDSAFSPTDSPELYERLKNAYELALEYNEVQEKLKMARSSMSIWNNPYSEFGRNEYNENEEEYEKYLELSEKLEALIEKTKRENDEWENKLIKEGKKFIGFKVTHSYRAKNNAGNIIFGKAYFFLDKDMKKIIASYGSEEYEMYEMLLKQIKLLNEQ